MNRIDEAKQILQTAAKRNYIELPKKHRRDSKDATLCEYKITYCGKETIEVIDCQTTTTKTIASDTQEYTLVDIMTSPTLRLHSIVLFYLWYVITSFIISTIHIHIHLNRIIVRSSLQTSKLLCQVFGIVRNALHFISWQTCSFQPCNYCSNTII